MTDWLEIERRQMSPFSGDEILVGDGSGHPHLIPKTEFFFRICCIKNRTSFCFYLNNTDKYWKYAVWNSVTSGDPDTSVADIIENAKIPIRDLESAVHKLPKIMSVYI